MPNILHPDKIKAVLEYNTYGAAKAHVRCKEDSLVKVTIDERFAIGDIDNYRIEKVFPGDKLYISLEPGFIKGIRSIFVTGGLYGDIKLFGANLENDPPYFYSEVCFPVSLNKDYITLSVERRDYSSSSYKLNIGFDSASNPLHFSASPDEVNPLSVYFSVSGGKLPIKVYYGDGNETEITTPDALSQELNHVYDEPGEYMPSAVDAARREEIAVIKLYANDAVVLTEQQEEEVIEEKVQEIKDKEEKDKEEGKGKGKTEEEILEEVKEPVVLPDAVAPVVEKPSDEFDFDTDVGAAKNERILKIRGGLAPYIVDYGDGSEPVKVASATNITKVFEKTGSRVVTVTDANGETLSRTVSIRK